MEEKPTIYIDILLADLITLVRGAVIYQDQLNILVLITESVFGPIFFPKELKQL